MWQWIPAVIFGSVLLSFTDRRLLLSLSAYLAGAAFILCIFFSSNSGKISKGSLWPTYCRIIGFHGSFNCLWCVVPGKYEEHSCIHAAAGFDARGSHCACSGGLGEVEFIRIFSGVCSSFGYLKQEMLLCMIPWSNRKRRRDSVHQLLIQILNWPRNNGLANFSVTRCF